MSLCLKARQAYKTCKDLCDWKARTHSRLTLRPIHLIAVRVCVCNTRDIIVCLAMCLSVSVCVCVCVSVSVGGEEALTNLVLATRLHLY